MMPSDLSLDRNDPSEAFRQGFLAVCGGTWSLEEYQRWALSSDLAAVATEESVDKLVSLLKEVAEHENEAVRPASLYLCFAMEGYAQSCVSAGGSKVEIGLRLYQAIRPVVVRFGPAVSQPEFSYREAYALRQGCRWTDAEKLYDEIIESRRALIRENEGELARALVAKGGLLRELNRNLEALQAFDRAVEIRARLAQEGREEYADRLASTHQSRGDAFAAEYRFDEAILAFDQTFGIYWELVNGGRKDLEVNLVGVLTRKAEAHTGRSEFVEAVAVCDKAIQIVEQIPDSASLCDGVLVTLLVEKAQALWRQAKGEAAEAACNRAITVIERLPPSAQGENETALGLALLFSGLALHCQRKWDKALSAYDRSIQVLEPLLRHPRRNSEQHLAIALSNKGVTLIAMSKWSDALAAIEKAIERLSPLLDSGRKQVEDLLGAAYVNKGMALMKQGRLPESLVASEAGIKALDPLVGAGRNELIDKLALALANRGAILLTQGRLAEGLVSCERAVEHYESIALERRLDIESDFARTLQNVGVGRESQGRLAEALDAFHRGIDKYELLIRTGRTDLISEFTLALTNTGYLLCRCTKGEHWTAILTETFARALRLLEESVSAGHCELESHLARILSHQVVLLLDAGSLSESEAACNRALEIFDRLIIQGHAELRADLMMAQMHQALVLQTQGRLVEARAILEKTTTESFPHENRRRYHWALADLLCQLDERHEALRHYDFARRLLRQSRRIAGIDETTIDYVAERAGFLDRCISCAIHLGENEDAFEAVQDGKAAIIGDVGERLRTVTEDTEVRAARRALTDFLRNRTVVEPEQFQDVELQSRTIIYLNSFHRARHPVLGTQPEANISNAAPPDRDAIQQHLPPKWAILDFWRLDNDSIHVFALTHDVFAVHKLELPATKLERKYGRFMRSIANPLSGDRNDQILDDLDAYLFARLRPWLREHNITGLYLVPHGFLHSLPLHAARSGAAYLCEQFDIAYLPSAAMLPQLPALHLDGPLFSISNPERGTPHSLLRLELVGSALKLRYERSRGGHFLSGPQGQFATTEDWSTAAIVHFSCHGSSQAGFAPLSHLRLADDLLLAHDVIHRMPPLRAASLVVLNGCQTSVGDTRAPNECMGLMTAFLLRGAGLVFATQWSVVDGCAAEVVLCFLEEILEKNSRPTDALRTAQSKVRKMTPDDLLHRWRDVEMLFEADSPEMGKWYAQKSWLCLRAGRTLEANHFAELARPVLCRHGLAGEADHLLSLTSNEGRASHHTMKIEGFDHPVFWSAFQLVGRVV